MVLQGVIVEKWLLMTLETALVDSPAASMPMTRSRKNLGICGIALQTKTAHFRVAFYCPFIGHTYVLIMLFKQRLDMLHLSSKCIIK